MPVPIPTASCAASPAAQSKHHGGKQRQTLLRRVSSTAPGASAPHALGCTHRAPPTCNAHDGPQDNFFSRLMDDIDARREAREERSIAQIEYEKETMQTFR